MQGSGARVRAVCFAESYWRAGSPEMRMKACTGPHPSAGNRAYWRLRTIADIAMSHQTEPLRLVPGDDTVIQAMQWLGDIAEREQLPPRTRFGLMLSMDEALTNVLSYAFVQGTESGEAPIVELTYGRDGPDLCVEIADNGRAYDPTTWSPAPLAHTLDEAMPGGQGVRLMRHYLKALRYRRDGGWNRLTLIAGHG